jgi:hypothetical protein
MAQTARETLRDTFAAVAAETQQTRTVRLVNRAVAKGQNRAEATALLTQGLEAHSGWNLVTFLTYNNFATETQAVNYVTDYHGFS